MREYRKLKVAISGHHCLIWGISAMLKTPGGGVLEDEFYVDDFKQIRRAIDRGAVVQC